MITHRYTPNEDGKKVVTETCEFESDLKDRHLSEATVILDFKNLKVVKSRDGNSFGAYVMHIKEAYPEEYPRFLQAIGREMRDVDAIR